MSSNKSKLVANKVEINDEHYKIQLKVMKKKMRLLFHERENLQQTLKTSQLQLLKEQQTKNYLLDMLVEFENVKLSSSDDELTESDEDDSIKPQPKKTEKLPAKNSSNGSKKQLVNPKIIPKIVKKKKKNPPKTSTSSKERRSNRPCSNNLLPMADNNQTFAELTSEIKNDLAADMFDDNFSFDIPPIFIDEEMIDVEILD